MATFCQYKSHALLAPLSCTLVIPIENAFPTLWHQTTSYVRLSQQSHIIGKYYETSLRVPISNILLSCFSILAQTSELAMCDGLYSINTFGILAESFWTPIISVHTLYRRTNCLVDIFHLKTFQELSWESLSGTIHTVSRMSYMLIFHEQFSAPHL